MLKRLSLLDFHKTLQQHIETKTGLKCYDNVPNNASSPFYYMEVVGKSNDDTKTMYCEVVTVWMHAIAEKSKSSVGIYNLINKLEEAMTEDLELPGDYELLNQVSTGVQTIKLDETDEKHAVLEYSFKINYGFKTKN